MILQNPAVGWKLSAERRERENSEIPQTLFKIPVILENVQGKSFSNTE